MRSGERRGAYESAEKDVAQMNRPPSSRPPGESTVRNWTVLSDEEAADIAEFGGIAVEKVRGIEMLVLLKAGKAVVAGLDSPPPNPSRSSAWG